MTICFKEIHHGLKGNTTLPTSMQILGPSTWLSRKWIMLNPLHNDNVQQAYLNLLSIVQVNLNKAEFLSSIFFDKDKEWDAFLTDFIYFPPIYNQLLSKDQWPAMPSFFRTQMEACVTQCHRITIHVLPVCVGAIDRVCAIYRGFFTQSRFFSRAVVKQECDQFLNNFYLIRKTLEFCLSKKDWKILPPELNTTVQNQLDLCEKMAKMDLARRKLTIFMNKYKIRRNVSPKDFCPIDRRMIDFLPDHFNRSLFLKDLTEGIQNIVASEPENKWISFVSKQIVGRAVVATLFRMKTTHNNNRIKVLAIVILGDKFAQGGFKDINKGLLIRIQGRCLSPIFSIDCVESIVARVDEPKRIERVKKGLAIHADILKKINSLKHRLFTPYPTYDYPTTQNALEIVTPWLQGNLLQAAGEKTLPESMLYFKKHPVEINLKDLLLILCDVCDALIEMHQLSYVHRDVKATNILVQYDEKLKRWIGRLGDFDITTSVGYESFKNDEYWYWSECMRHGLVSFEGDGFGVIMALGELFFLESFHPFLKDRSLILTPKFDTLLFNFMKDHTLMFLRKYPSTNSDAIDEIAPLSDVNQDRTLFDCLERMLQNDRFAWHHANILLLKKELIMYQMVHSFIKNSVLKDVEIYEEAKSELGLFEGDKNKFVTDFFQKIKRKHGDIFAIPTLKDKIKLMYESLE